MFAKIFRFEKALNQAANDSDDDENIILPDGCMKYHFSAFNERDLVNRELYTQAELTEFVHEHALVSVNLGKYADKVFQLIESHHHLNQLILQADYEHPLRQAQQIQLGGLYNKAAVRTVLAALRQSDFAAIIAHFTDNEILSDELMMIFNGIKAVFEFAECENKVVIAYLA
ncbi:hypothetical protein [Alysiella filiformis]|uniref:Uncharacterized protein n=1 Tax=Alysiella filiformis DSM 16848 TaxID=1120981 RepID=A0A286EAI0_9NEIS|nr:hypothetical protein [Alysiella filiformis]QMT32304.1 hypothetical protein H3L97_05595 [Alysiella filiformis]UBQ56778.1 hypothetical protein JF568_03095 [Alysiella filiformis DSM 16848]SOD67903.1 hypothetical protein SAMN02746062_01042 [Alysiella filiformis DSM 16848]